MLGALVNWVLGRFFGQMTGKHLFSDTPKIRRVTHWYKRYGWLNLLESRVLIVGDLFTLRAGVMREAL